MKRRWIALSAALASLTAAHAAVAACSFRMDVLDVGQGDATFIQTPDCHTALIDGGDAGSGAVIRSHLAELGITSLDLVIVSHYHQDHLAGIVEIAQGNAPIPVDEVLDRGDSYDSETFQNYALLYEGLRREARAGDILPLGNEVVLTVISANANGLSATDENSLSVGVKLTYGELDVMIAGDLTGASGGGAQDMEARVAPVVGPVEIYHVDHHGSAESSNATLLALLRPDVSLVSVGWDNSYGHPTAEALNRLENAGSVVYQTEDPQTQQVLGTISVTSTDGLTYTVTQGSASTTYMARADGAMPVRTPTAVTVYRGNQATSTTTPLEADDGSSWQAIASSRSGVYLIDWSAQLELGYEIPSSLALVLNERYSTTREQTVSLWDPGLQSWQTLAVSTVANKEKTVTYDVPEPTRYLDSSGALQVRFTGSERNSSYKVYADALFAVWEP